MHHSAATGEAQARRRSVNAQNSGRHHEAEGAEGQPPRPLPPPNATQKAQKIQTGTAVPGDPQREEKAELISISFSFLIHV